MTGVPKDLMTRSTCQCCGKHADHSHLSKNGLNAQVTIKQSCDCPYAVFVVDWTWLNPKTNCFETWRPDGAK